MGKKIMIDPIKRIEGHLRIEVEVENGKVKDAWSSGQMFRGIEIMLKGRLRLRVRTRREGHSPL